MSKKKEPPKILYARLRPDGTPLSVFRRAPHSRVDTTVYVERYVSESAIRAVIEELRARRDDSPVIDATWSNGYEAGMATAELAVRSLLTNEEPCEEPATPQQ